MTQHELLNVLRAQIDMACSKDRKKHTVAENDAMTLIRTQRWQTKFMRHNLGVKRVKWIEERL